MFENIYKGEILKEEREKAKFVLTQVFKYYYNNPEEMPEFYKSIVRGRRITYRSSRLYFWYE